MLTKEQETEIRDYLLSKKLPIDILLELNDHFIAQISDLQQTEDIDFNAAFELTKVSWKEELSTYFPGYVFNQTIDAGKTRLEQKIRNKANKDLFLKSIFMSFLIFLSFYTGALILNYSQFLKFFKVEICFIIAFAFLPLLYNSIFNSFAFKEKNSHYKFPIHRWTGGWIGALVFLFFSYNNLVKSLILNLKNHDYTFEFFSIILVFFILVLLYTYTGIAQIKLAQTLEKLKPHLKNYSDAI